MTLTMPRFAADTAICVRELRPSFKLQQDPRATLGGVYGESSRRLVLPMSGSHCTAHTEPSLLQTASKAP